MTINSVNRAAPTVVRATESAPAAAPQAPAAAPQSTGYAATSSYSASTGSSTNTSADTKKAIDLLKDVPGSDKLKKLLSEPYMTREEAGEAVEEFNKIAGSIPEKDRGAIEQAVMYESCVSGSIALGKMIMDRLIEQLKNNKIIPQY